MFLYGRNCRKCMKPIKKITQKPIMDLRFILEHTLSNEPTELGLLQKNSLYSCDEYQVPIMHNIT